MSVYLENQTQNLNIPGKKYVDFLNAVQSRFSESRLFEVPFRPNLFQQSNSLLLCVRNYFKVGVSVCICLAAFPALPFSRFFEQAYCCVLNWRKDFDFLTVQLSCIHSNIIILFCYCTLWYCSTLFNKLYVLICVLYIYIILYNHAFCSVIIRVEHVFGNSRQSPSFLTRTIGILLYVVHWYIDNCCVLNSNRTINIYTK
jgi:hypothetical protein